MPSIFIGWQKHSVRGPFGPGNLLVVSGETGKLGTYEKKWGRLGQARFRFGDKQNGNLLVYRRAQSLKLTVGH